MTDVTFELDEIDVIAQRILAIVDCKTLLFYGDLGAGKTTLINALVKALGGTSPATSPTFSLINEYKITNGMAYHFDMYRLDDPYQALDFGIEEYLYSDEWIFIEWPDKIDVLLPESSVKLYIKTAKNGSRTLKIELSDNELKKS